MVIALEPTKYCSWISKTLDNTRQTNLFTKDYILKGAPNLAAASGASVFLT